MRVALYGCVNVWIVLLLETKEPAHVFSTVLEFKKGTHSPPHGKGPSHELSILPVQPQTVSLPHHENWVHTMLKTPRLRLIPDGTPDMPTPPPNTSSEIPFVSALDCALSGSLAKEEGNRKNADMKCTGITFPSVCRRMSFRGTGSSLPLDLA